MIQKVTIYLLLLLPIVVFSQPTASFTINSPNNTYCLGDTVVITNTSQNYTISYWTFGDQTDTWAQNPKHVYQNAANFTINLVVYDNSGNSSNFFVDITVNVAPILTLINNKTQQTITAQTTGGTSFTYIWYFNNLSTAETNPVVYYFESGLYSTKVTNEFQCSDSSAIVIDLSAGSSGNENDTLKIIVENNILTPDNHDGINDVLFIKELSTFSSNCQVQIFNKWGQLVYSNENYTNLGGFEGYDNTGKKLNTGTYYYIITSKDRKTATGYIDLIR